MADISQVKLPDGTTYNLKDSYVRTNYRALSNNDFDTINVTELNAGDLIVTGAARFLNTINGSISGNAVTATTASYTKLYTNEIRLAGKPSSAQTIYVGYKWSDGTSAALINRWKFCNGNGALTEVEASTFYGALSGNASSATTASKLGSSNVGSATNPIYLASGTATACTYSLNKTVPSDAVFTDQYVSQSATTTSDYRKIVLSYQNGAAGAAVTSNTNVVYVTANAEVQPSTGNIRSAGTVSAANLSATSNVSGLSLGVSSTTGTTGGISLYGGVGNVTSYGIAMRGTGNGGKHGAVQGDWAIYNYMLNYGGHRGWIWKNSASDGGNVASIDCLGNAVFNGYVGIGGNTTNTSGVRQVYNSTTKSLDFVFVA